MRTASPFPPDTYTVAQLATEIRDFLSEAFTSVWVAGEVQRPRRSERGHLYFELVEKNDSTASPDGDRSQTADSSRARLRARRRPTPRDRIVGRLEAVVWRRDYQRVRRVLAAAGEEIREGQSLRCLCQVDFYPGGGRLQLVVREVDPMFTLGDLALRRRETLLGLEQAGLLDRNRRLSLPPVPLEVGLVTSRESAAYRDFLATLEESGYGFRVRFAHAAVQGATAAAELERALRVLCARGSGPSMDVLALVRGGGARSDLAVFDDQRLAESIARAPVPVLTGLGHEIDESICDRVAHTSAKTPTKAAELLVESVAAAERRLAAQGERLLLLARQRLERADSALARTERSLALARVALRSTGSRIAGLARALSAVARGRLVGLEQRRREVEGRLGPPARRAGVRAEQRRREAQRRLEIALAAQLETAGRRVEGLERLCRGLAPERILERGFSITRSAAGELVRRAVQVKGGEIIRTQLASGTLESRVSVDD